MEEVVNQEQKLVPQTPVAGERNYGLDLLRIISMLMVLICHVSNYSFLCGIIAEGSVQDIIRRVLVAFSIVMINCYILTSSYFLVKLKFRLSRLFKLELIVVFWLAICCVIYAIRKVPDFWENEFLIPFFPVVLRVFWFYSAYVGLCLVSPLLNILIRHMSKGLHLGTCIMLVLMATILNNVMSFTNAFTFADGYNMAWFVVLYFVGAYLRLHVNPDNIKVWVAILIYVLMCACIVGDWFLLEFLTKNNTWFGARFASSSPYNYNSVFVFLSSLAFFMIFLRVKIKTRPMKWIIKFTAPHVFAVYILDRGYIGIWQNELLYKWFNYPQLPFLQIFTVVIVLFMLRVLLDYLRSLLFLLFEKRNWYKNFLKNMDQFPYWVSNKLNKNEGESV